MILLSSPSKYDPLETMVSIFFFLEIEIVKTKIVDSKSLKKICRQLLSTMNALKILSLTGIFAVSWSHRSCDHQVLLLVSRQGIHMCMKLSNITLSLEYLSLLELFLLLEELVVILSRLALHHLQLKK